MSILNRKWLSEALEEGLIRMLMYKSFSVKEVKHLNCLNDNTIYC